MLGTLRSIGAGKKASYGMLIGESKLYGVFGGTFGCGIGVGILYVLSKQNAEGGAVSLTLNAMQIPLTLIMAMVLVFISSIILIIKTMQIPIKDLVLNTMQIKHVVIQPAKCVLGGILLVLAFLVPNLVSGEIAVALNIICIVFGIAGIVLLIPIFTYCIVFILQRIFHGIFKNIGGLAARNLLDNKPMMNNITLLAIGIATILMVNVISKSTTIGIINFAQNTTHYDMTFGIPKMDDKTIKIIEDVEGVERACGFYSINNITVSDQPTKLKAFLGIDPETYLNYSDLTVNDQNPQEALDKLASGRNILLGSKFASRIGVTEGDEVTFTLNQKQVTYTVVGILDIMEQDGSIALVSNKLLVEDTDMSSYSGIYITASEGEKPDEVLENVRNTFPNEVSSGGTMAEHQEHILKETGGIFKMMNSMSMLCMLIGILKYLPIPFSLFTKVVQDRGI